MTELSFVAAILAAFVGLWGTYIIKSINLLNKRVDLCVTHEDMQEYIATKLENIRIVLDSINTELRNLKDTLQQVTQIKIKE